MAKEVRAAHILVRGEDYAKEVLGNIRKGMDFKEQAKKHSLCPSGKNGGDLGWFGRQKMVKEFEKAAFDAEKDQVVGPVKTQFGYHIIKVIDKR
jgi:peptidyl-prolyl cis-trans isomerase C